MPKSRPSKLNRARHSHLKAFAQTHTWAECLQEPLAAGTEFYELKLIWQISSDLDRPQDWETAKAFMNDFVQGLRAPNSIVDEESAVAAPLETNLNADPEHGFVSLTDGSIVDSSSMSDSDASDQDPAFMAMQPLDGPTHGVASAESIVDSSSMSESDVSEEDPVFMASASLELPTLPFSEGPASGVLLGPVPGVLPVGSAPGVLSGPVPGVLPIGPASGVLRGPVPVVLLVGPPMSVSSMAVANPPPPVSPFASQLNSARTESANTSAAESVSKKRKPDDANTSQSKKPKPDAESGRKKK